MKAIRARRQVRDAQSKKASPYQQKRSQNVSMDRFAAIVTDVGDSEGVYRSPSRSGSTVFPALVSETQRQRMACQRMVKRRIALDG